MRHSKTSDIIPLRGYDSEFPVVAISGVKCIMSLRCFVVAQERTKSFSINPVEFNFMSEDIMIMPCQIVAAPLEFKRDDTVLTEPELYIESSTFNIDAKVEYKGQIFIKCIARAIQLHINAPVAFYVIEYEDYL